MPASIRNRQPLNWVPTGVSDSIDGTNSFKGAMTSLVNLVPNPSTKGTWVPRSAQMPATTFPGFTGAGVVNCIYVVGNVCYGMIATTSGPYSGKDQPFAYNVMTNTFYPIAIPQGVASLPATPNATGDWTPPQMAQVAERILITHPGYAGAPGPYFFGWLDISSFTSNTITGSIASGSNQLTLLSANVEQAGWQVGMAIAGSGIPANTTVTAINVQALDVNTTGVLSFGTNQITSVASLTGVVPGCTISGLGIPTGTLVQSLPGGGVVNMTNAATQAGTFTLNFAGAVSATMSNNASATAGNVVFTVSGGTPTAPVYGAGNTNTNPLPSVPVDVANFNGAAFYACGVNGIPFSDVLNPCQVTNANQALTPQNGLAVTALGALPLTAALTGGVAAALIAFQGDSNMLQIQGSYALNTLSMQALGIGVGTLAANTICSTPGGLAFIAPDGLRVIDFVAQVSEPIGAYGQGVWLPFLDAVNPTRMNASYNNDTIRVSVQNGLAPGQGVQEFWFHYSAKVWSGPHTGAAALIEPWQQEGRHGFISTLVGVNATLFLGSPLPQLSDTYTENGVALSWTYSTILLPDQNDLAMHSMVISTLAALIANNQTINISAADELGNILQNVSMSGAGAAVTLWGSVTWDSFVWAGGSSFFRQQLIPWADKITFKQFRITISGLSTLAMALGNLYLLYQQLGYTIPPPAITQNLTALQGATSTTVISAQ